MCQSFLLRCYSLGWRSSIVVPGPLRQKIQKFSSQERNYLKLVSNEKLRWVESGVIRQVWASYCGPGHYFVVLGGLHLVFTFFPFRSVLPKL
jgi:hypothetical protein